MPGHRRGADSGADPEDGGKRRATKHRGRLLKIAVLGGAVALLVSEDLRNQLLDALFGAEEEFDYSSLTEPPAPGTSPEHSAAEAEAEAEDEDETGGERGRGPEPEVAAEPELPRVSPWVGAARDDLIDEPPPSDQPPQRHWAATRMTPPPEAWSDPPPEGQPPEAPRREAVEGADVSGSPDQPESAESPDDPAPPESPALPSDWWAPEASAGSPPDAESE
jgi:hypothetical protein